jgi:non-ribosomal peptide synthetase component F
VVFQEDPQALDWWVGELIGVPVLWLPTDLPRPEAKGTRAANHDEFLDLQLARDIEELARSTRSTPFMVLLTAFQLTLAQRSGQRDFCIGVPADGRDTVEAEQAVGLFANMLAIRLRANQHSFAAQMKQTRSTFIEALSRQAVPFGQIVTKLDLAHVPDQTQVFQTIFCLHTEATPRTDLPGLAIEPFSAGHPQALHDLVLDLWRNDAGIVAAFRYDSCLFKPDTIADLARRYIEVLRAAAADPEGAL